MRRGLAKDVELPAGFVEMSPQTLQILLHELRALGKGHSTDDAQYPVKETVEDAEESPAGLHIDSVSWNARMASAPADTSRFDVNNACLPKEA